jgi:arylsulfatase A-like enzyme
MATVGAVRPNVLFITLDQFRGDCLGVAGHPVVRTPGLDELAADGARFTRHYSQRRVRPAGLRCTPACTR